MTVVAEEGGSAAAAPRLSHRTAPFLWSVRRELWENAALYIAPGSAAILALVGFVLGASSVLRRYGAQVLMTQKDAVGIFTAPFEIGAALILLVGGLTVFFYCLGALHNERRDRSILFWKSMPVSDLVTVLSKAAIPMVVAPVIFFAVIVVMQALMFVLETLVFVAHGLSASFLWSHLNLLSWEGAVLWLIVVSTLWYAPIYGWLLLVSGGARRVTFLWAILPPIALVVFEKLAFGSNYMGVLIWKRLTGAISVAFSAASSPDQIAAGGAPHIDVAGVLGQPELWGGVIVAVALGGACVWLRRYREPI